MELNISLETICRLIVRARELEALVPTIETEEDLDPSETDDALAAIEEDVDNSVEEEIRALLDDMADDEIVEVLALAWVGRGTYDASEWEEALEEAADPDAENPIDQLFEMPMLSAYLEAGLAAFDLSCDGIGQIV